MENIYRDEIYLWCFDHLTHTLYKILLFFPLLFVLLPLNFHQNMPTPRGQMQKAAVKYGMGGGMVLGLIFIIWFPLIFVSFANTVSIANPPQMSEISVSFSGYQVILENGKKVEGVGRGLFLDRSVEQ